MPDTRPPSAPTPDDGDASARRSFNQRLRDRYFGRGRAGAATSDGSESVLPKSNQMGFFGRVQRPGGFDTPPAEPLEFEGPLPWELSDSDDAGFDDRDSDDRDSGPHPSAPAGR